MQTETLVLERVYPASPSKLFAAWTDIAVLRRWFGCAEDMLWNVHSWDVRPGGAIDVSLEFEHGPFRATGEFVVVDPPHRLRYRWCDDEMVEVTIEPHDGGSRLHLEHTFVPRDDARAILTGGWTNSLAQLGSAVATEAELCPEPS